MITIYSQITKQDHETICLKDVGKEPITYGELRSLVQYTQEILWSNNINKTDRVCIVTKNESTTASLFLGIVSTCTCAPLNPALRLQEYNGFLRDLQPKLIILEENCETFASEAAKTQNIPIIWMVPAEKAGQYSLTGKRIHERGKDLPNENDTALILHTSGTTSTPKMVPLSQKNLITSAQNIAETLKLCSRDTSLCVMPLFHIHGLVGVLLSSIISSAQVACPGYYNVAKITDWIKEFNPTWYSAVPTIHQSILEKLKKDQVRPNGIRLIRSSSSSLSPKLMREMEEWWGTPVIEAYGMTEASHQMSSNLLPSGKRKPGSVGKPTGLEIKIMDDQGNFVADGSKGEVVIKGTTVTSGYLNREPGTGFVDGWFRTGDEGYFDEEGYLVLTDRIKEIINRSGEKVSPREIDETIQNHPNVKRAVSFPVPDSFLGEEIAVAVVAEGVSEWDLQKYAAQSLADYKIPRKVFFMDEIPKGPTGKIQRVNLAETLNIVELSYSEVEPVEYVEPETISEKQLADIWSKHLGVRVGLHDNYFNLGGDSLRAAEILSDVRKKFKKDRIPLVVFLHAPTVAEMVNLLESRDTTNEALVTLKNGVGVPVFLVHACLGNVFFYKDLAMGLVDRPVYGLRYTELDDYNSVEELADHYLEGIRRQQPNDSLIIGGAGVGGIIAYEMSQRLGDRVTELWMFDSLTPKKENYDYNIWKRIRYHIDHGTLLRIVSITLHHRIMKIFREDHRITDKIRKTVNKYNPQPYAGKVKIFVSNTRIGHPAPATRLQQWENLLIGPHETHVITGEHLNILKPSHVSAIIEILNNETGEGQSE